MEPLSALSIAAAVVQFVDFGSSLVSKSHEIYKSAQGASISQVESEHAVRRLLGLNETLKASQAKNGQVHGSNEAQALKTICDNCVDLSNELLTRFDKLRVHDSDKYCRWKSF
jgi:hypothetical protein